ncbi:MAG: acyl-CoA thioesterase [Bacteroidetes bacterium]|nr:MAG: acyl-CoA thioesterase [Bacteroidota bacterium]REK06996.1 MAG: acyl-CoA thioesterase [Bacteroidota bacterium]REK33657.1 MAG: acyl-CoA thioesterase [Bacteroidota bacterium]REK48643.1 MAG: acyl-CoA thioesterase [Bacteroidota bacterium]
MKSASDIFRHKSKIEIRFADIDAFNHVNNARYLTYFEQARIEYFNEIIGWNYDWSKQGIILARAEIDFIVPVNLNDEVYVHTRCSRLGKKSFDLEYKMTRKDANSEITVCSGKTVMVAFDYEMQKSIEIPDDWKKIIRSHEGMQD